MKKSILSILKVVLPLALGLYLVWYFYDSLGPQDRKDIVISFEKANYTWVLISLIFALLSHMSRAYRWNYTLEPLGYRTKFWNNFFAVMIGYLVNLAVPRLGEVSRCGVTARYEKIPFNKLLGTVIAERIADLIILLAVSLVVVYMQLDVIRGLLLETVNALKAKFSAPLVFGLLAAMVIGGLFVLYILLWSKSQLPIVIKVREAIRDLMSGVASIFRMKKKWQFLAHTLFIWLMYLFMFYLCFFSLPETSGVPFEGILTAFAISGFTIAATNGGIGAYPLAVQGVLTLYEVDKVTGGAFGWIVWTAQTIMLIALGAASFILMPLYNKKFAHVETGTRSA